MSEDDLILSRELFGQGFGIDESGASDGVFGEKGSTQGPGGCVKKFSSQHGAISLWITYADSGREENYVNVRILGWA